MSLIDRLIARVTPLVSDDERLRARRNARARARPGGIVEAILDDHERLEAELRLACSAGTSEAQHAAELRFAALLNAHSAAEEAVVYPELVENRQHGDAFLGYQQQAAAKVQVAILGKLQPKTQDHSDKLDHIRGAVTQHMYQEERGWLLDLERSLSEDASARVRARYVSNMERFSSSKQ